MSLPAALGPLLDEPRRAGVFCDFDGTLAPIVDDPAAARPLAGVVDALAALAARMGLVAVISGRPARFLLEHLDGAGVSIWGQYGMERVEGGRVVPAPGAEGWGHVVEEVAARAQKEIGGLLGVEAKAMTLTVHHRTAPGRASLAREWVERAAAETGLVVHAARMSYELRPPVPHGKGAVVEETAGGLAVVCFFGDDQGDLDAFDALDRLSAAGTATVRVAVDSDEAPPELLERADLTVDGPGGVLATLRALAGPAGGDPQPS